MKIILDGMGGDNAPASVVEGAVLASKEMEHEIVLIGQQELIEKELKKYKYDEKKISIVDAREVITNDEAPVRAVRSKKDSSIVRGINMVKSGEGDIFISEVQEHFFREDFSFSEEFRGSTGLHLRRCIRLSAAERLFL